MPRANNNTSSHAGVKREASTDPDDPHSPASADTKPIKPTKKPKKVISSTKAAPQPWTADELDTLLTIALAKGASLANFEGQVPGRTGNQCMRTWS